MTQTTHISWKAQELPLRQRERELSNILKKNTSDTYKYCLNRVYLQVMEEKDSGKQISFYWSYQSVHHPQLYPLCLGWNVGDNYGFQTWWLQVCDVYQAQHHRKNWVEVWGLNKLQNQIYQQFWDATSWVLLSLLSWVTYDQRICSWQMGQATWSR